MATVHTTPQPLFEALIGGLGVKSQNLGSKCEAALRAVGGVTLPHLSAAAAETSRHSRNRIETLAATISDRQESSLDAGDLCFKALFVAAAVQNDQDNPMLIPALKLLGPPVVDTLIKDAILNRNKPAVCLRILKVVEQLGDPSTVLGQFEVSTLFASKDEAVRVLAFRLFRSKRPSPRALEAGVSA